jgi:hypothetical protein
MIKLSRVENKIIEGRSKKSQEKFADQLMTFSTNIVLVGFVGMLALIREAYKQSSLLDIFLVVIVFLFCLYLSKEVRGDALDIYDRINKEDTKALKNSPTKRK